MLYVAPDGNYGEAEYLVVVDDENFDDHFVGYLDSCSDWQRPDYAKWFEDNQHEFELEDDPTDEYMEVSCKVCEDWLDSFAKIQS